MTQRHPRICGVCMSAEHSTGTHPAGSYDLAPAPDRHAVAQIALRRYWGLVHAERPNATWEGEGGTY